MSKAGLIHATNQLARDFKVDETRLKMLKDKIMRQGSDYVKDAEGAYSFARELELIESEVYRTEYVAYKAKQVFPIDMQGGEWTQSRTYRVYDTIGTSVYINSSQSTDIPFTKVVRKEITSKVVERASQYGYTFQELAAAAHTGMALDAEESLSCRNIVERDLDKLAWNGDAAHQVSGFLSNPDIPVGNVVNGVSGSPDWKRKTPGEILLDVLDGIATMISLTGEVEEPNKLLVPTYQYNLLQQPRSSNSDTTIKSWLITNIDQFNSPDDIMSIPLLKGAGVGGVDRMALYKKDQRKLIYSLPMPIKIEMPERNGLRWDTIVRASTAGVIVRYPLSVSFLDRI